MSNVYTLVSLQVPPQKGQPASAVTLTSACVQPAGLLRETITFPLICTVLPAQHKSNIIYCLNFCTMGNCNFDDNTLQNCYRRISILQLRGTRNNELIWSSLSAHNLITGQKYKAPTVYFLIIIAPKNELKTRLCA